MLLNKSLGPSQGEFFGGGGWILQILCQTPWKWANLGGPPDLANTEKYPGSQSMNYSSHSTKAMRLKVKPPRCPARF